MKMPVKDPSKKTSSRKASDPNRCTFETSDGRRCRLPDSDGEFGADFLRLHELPLLLGMEDAERRVSGGAREAATAAVGGFKRAAIGVRSFARRSFL